MFGGLKNLFGSSGGTKVKIQDRFKVLGKSGMGSMSRVFRAEDKKLGKVVCLKILDKEKTAKFEARFAGLKRPSEGAICAELKHPHIVETYEHGLTIDDEQFLVQEWIDGPLLHTLIETQHAQLDGNRVKYLAQAAEALQYIHERKYLHRDICPRNLMITPRGTVKFIDFGLTIPYTPEFCKPGNRTGTVQYLAPEIIKRVTTDHRVDLYALGVTAYEVFTGQLPWGRSESLETMFSHMNRPPTDPRDYRSDLDEPTVKFLLKAIEREPARRFQTATEFRDAIQKLGKKW